MGVKPGKYSFLRSCSGMKLNIPIGVYSLFQYLKMKERNTLEALTIFVVVKCRLVHHSSIREGIFQSYSHLVVQSRTDDVIAISPNECVVLLECQLANRRHPAYR